jgi:hypothetical protein
MVLLLSRSEGRSNVAFALLSLFYCVAEEVAVVAAATVAATVAIVATALAV